MIAVRYVLTDFDEREGVGAYAVTANDQPIGVVLQRLDGTWQATVPKVESRFPTPCRGGYRKRSDAVEWLLDEIGALG